VLEIGAGTGYNAALLAYLADPHGHVTTVDVDTDVVAEAQRLLASARVDNVDVVRGDGALGYSNSAPYDRIVATVGAYGIPDSWLSQLAPGGRLVVPLRVCGSVSRSIAFERSEDGGWHSVDHQMCGFVPLRDGIADDLRHTITLTADKAVTLHLNQEHTADHARLAGVFDQPRTEVWTGVTFGPMKSMEWMYLWFACTQEGDLCRMTVEQSAVDSGLVNPMFQWGAMAVVGDRELAYLTWRAAEGARDRRERAEIGVIRHGPTGTALADQVAEEIRTWSEKFRDRHVRFEIPTGGIDSADPRGGRFFLDRPHNPITVIWQ
jgi:protein-L-isoaspartate(D-aspartate) O-methyltransferase